MMDRRRAVASVWALLAVFALLGAACSSESSEPGDASSDGGAEEVTTTAVGDDGEAPATTAVGTEERTASDVGVTEDTITVSYITPDLSALVALGIADDVAPSGDAISALAAAVNARGGINGRTLEVGITTYDPVQGSSAITACTQVAQDSPNFAAFSPSFFGDGATCLAGDEGVPLLTQSGMAGVLFEEAEENLFLFNLTFEQVQQHLVDYLEEQGALEGRTLGAVIRDEPGGIESVERGLIPALAELGYEVEIATITGSAAGDPAVLSAAVQRLSEQGVDAVFLLANILVSGGFVAAAQQAGYEPTFFVSDQSETNSNLLFNFGPVELLDDAVGTTHRRASGGPAPEISEADAACIEDYGDLAADLEPGTSLFNGYMQICQMFGVLVQALEGAGLNPTRASFVASMEALGSFELGTGGMGSFGPGKHTVVDELRPIALDPSCQCWLPTGDFFPVG